METTESTFTIDGRRYQLAGDRQRFELGAKALDAKALDNGDLILEGWAARWEVDRENEAFLPGAFDAGIKAFLGGTANLVFHHSPTRVLGRVLALERRDEGLWVRARVNGAIRSNPELAHLYGLIKSGDLTGTSVGGFFKRVQTPNGPRIAGVDMTELSISPMPVGGHKTRVAVVAGAKALGVGVEPLPHDDVRDLTGGVDRLRLAVLGLQAQQLTQSLRA